MSPRFRADHVGSLLRPPALRQAFRDQREGKISPDQFHAVQDEVVREVVQLQESVGLQSITDGEFRRISYWGHFVEKVAGFSVGTAAYRFHDDAGNENQFLAPQVDQPVRHIGPISGGEFDFVQANTTQTPKITLPSPPTMHFWRGDATLGEDSYPDVDAYFADLSQIFQTEIADLAARGCTYIQIDEVPLAMLCAADVRAQVAAAGTDPESLIGKYIDLINQALTTVPDTMTVSMHLCQGNFKGRWLSAGSYEHVGERLFNEVNVNSFFLEYDTPRVGDFTPLRHVPNTKSVVLGLISSKVGELESIDHLRRRVDAAAVYIDRDRLGISPQCGFSSTVGGNPITIDDQKRKLALVVEAADAIWGA